DVFLELGPHAALVPALSQCAAEAGRPAVVAHALRRGQDGRATMLAALGRLYAAGVDPAWREVWPLGGRLVDLPHYPWQRRRHWIEAKAPRPPAQRHARGELHVMELAWERRDA